MNRDQMAAHLALAGGAFVLSRTCERAYGLFIPGYATWWSDDRGRSSKAVTADVMDRAYWVEAKVHPRDVEDPHYDILVSAAKQEGAL